MGRHNLPAGLAIDVVHSVASASHRATNSECLRCATKNASVMCGTRAHGCSKAHARSGGVRIIMASKVRQRGSVSLVTHPAFVVVSWSIRLFVWPAHELCGEDESMLVFARRGRGCCPCFAGHTVRHIHWRCKRGAAFDCSHAIEQYCPLQITHLRVRRTEHLCTVARRGWARTSARARACARAAANGR